MIVTNGSLSSVPAWATAACCRRASFISGVTLAAVNVVVPGVPPK